MINLSLVLGVVVLLQQTAGGGNRASREPTHENGAGKRDGELAMSRMLRSKQFKASDLGLKIDDLQIGVGPGGHRGRRQTQSGQAGYGKIRQAIAKMHHIKLYLINHRSVCYVPGVESPSFG